MISTNDESAFGPYLIKRELGRGGQGVVYLATDTRLRRDVALKVLLCLGPSSSESVKRFQREASLTARLSDTGICTVLEAGVEAGAPFIAMEFIEGSSLAQLIARSREDEPEASTVFIPSSEEHAAIEVSSGVSEDSAAPTTIPRTRGEIRDVTTLMEQVARSVHAAHEAGVIHRDLKPGNIMVRADGRPVMLDFGMARSFDNEDVTLTRSGDFFGTPAYMSPEQLTRNTIQLDRRTDVYSLGVTLYECLTKQRPFNEPTRDSLYQAILTKEPRDPRKLNPSIPKDLSAIVAMAIEKDRDRRYQTAEELADDLQRWRELRPIHARLPGPGTRLLRWAQRNRALAGSLFAVLSLLTAGLIIVTVLLGRQVTLNRNLEAEQKRARSNLEAWNRMSDVRVLQELEEEEGSLWPAWPERLPKMRAWLDRADALIANAPEHRAWLVREESRPADELDVDRRWSIDVLKRHLIRLEQLKDPLSGKIAAVKRRLQSARRIESIAPEERARTWRHVRDEVARHPAYAGLLLGEQTGLVPLGPDPDSGLWEFADVQSGEIAVRDRESGRLTMTADTGIVFVLVRPSHYPADVPEFDDDPELGSAERSRQAANVTARIQLEWLGEQRSNGARTFFVSKFEMTRAQWQRLTSRDPDTETPLRAVTETVMPAGQVSWDDCNALLPKVGMRLPTVDEWQGAAAAPGRAAWATGMTRTSLRGAANLLDQQLLRIAGERETHEYLLDRWLDDGYPLAAPVGSYRANSLGLHDVHGNLLEWCSDYFLTPDASGGGRALEMFRAYSERIGSLAIPGLLEGLTGAAQIITRDYRVIMGGAYCTPALLSAVQVRLPMHREMRLPFIGVRPVRDIQK